MGLRQLTRWTWWWRCIGYIPQVVRLYQLALAALDRRDLVDIDKAIRGGDEQPQLRFNRSNHARVLQSGQWQHRRGPRPALCEHVRHLSRNKVRDPVL